MVRPLRIELRLDVNKTPVLPLNDGRMLTKTLAVERFELSSQAYGARMVTIPLHRVNKQ